VNTTSDGLALTTAANVSRDSSTIRRAARPDPCSEEALPTLSIDRTITSMTSG
jgi:hypothetical protein